MEFLQSASGFELEQETPNSFEGLEPERVEWEKKIGFLALLNSFGTFGFLASAKFNENKIREITRNDIKNFLESFYIVNQLDWIKKVMPEKIIRFVDEDSNYFGYDVEKKIKNDQEYINCVNPIMYKIIIEKYITLTPNEKNVIFENITNSYKISYCGTKMIFDFYVSKIEENLNMETNMVINMENEEKLCNLIFDFFSSFHNYEKIGSFVEYINKLYSIYQESITNNEKPTKFDVYKMKFELAKNINNLEFINSLKTHRAVKSFNSVITDDDKTKFVDNYFLNAEPNVICDMYNYEYEIKKIFNNVAENKELKKIIKETKLKLFRTKYLDELNDEDKEKYITYKLDYNTHYELFKLDEQQYLKILTDNILIDDWTFGAYNFNDFSFLNMFNDEVKTYLKNKIIADTSHIVKHEKRHTPISTLDNLIDIMYFTNNPPEFLKSFNGVKYYSKYIEHANKYLEKINYDEKKKSYQNIKIKVIFETC